MLWLNTRSAEFLSEAWLSPADLFSLLPLTPWLWTWRSLFSKILIPRSSNLHTQPQLHLLFFFLNIYLFNWLWSVLVVACRIFSCGMWTLSCSMCDLVPWPGIKLGPWHCMCWVLTTRHKGIPEISVLFSNCQLLTTIIFAYSWLSYTFKESKLLF